MDVAEQVSQARENLVLDARWYGTAAMRLQSIADPSVETASTDGTVMRWNPEYMAKLPPRVQKTVWAHETLHCTLRHLWRVGGKDLPTANRAADYVVNAILKQDPAMELGADWLYDPQYDDAWDFERVYAHLRHQDQKQDQPGPGQPGKPDPNGQPGPGDFEQPPDAAKADGQQLSEGDWALYAEQVTAMMQKAGKVPGGVARALETARQPVQDWKSLLAEFVANSIPTDTSWSRPNRRYMAAMDVYLPGAVKENIGPIAVAIDTSGSVTRAMLDSFAAELTAIVKDAQPECLRVVYCNTRIQSEQTFEPDDEINLRAIGGGGTAFEPVMDWVRAMDEPPVCLVYLTDLASSDRPTDPGVPTLWTTPGHVRRPAPFGDVIRMTV